MKKSIEVFIEGEHLVSLGLLTLAREKFIEALELNRQNRDEEGVGVCLVYLVQIEIKDNHKEAAQAYLEQARAHYKQRNLEKMLSQLDLLQETVEALEQKPENSVSEPISGIIDAAASADPFQLFRNGEIEAAAEIFLTDVARFRESGIKRELALSLLYLGQCQIALGKNEFARKDLTEAREIAREIQDSELLQAIEAAYENIELILQQSELDRFSIQELLRQNLPPAKLLLILLSKAEILILKGLSKEAEIAIHEARKILPRENPEKYLVFIMVVESKLLRLRRKAEPAKKVLVQAAEIAQKIQEPELIRLVEKSMLEIISE